MQKLALATHSTMVLVLAWVLVGCDKGPTRPFVLNPPPPGSPGPVTLTTFEITGPATVAPDSTEQFRAMASYSNETTRDVTNEASWLSSDASVLSISSTGGATGLERGEATISARFEGRSTVKGGVMVLPPGTYRVSGAVRDAGLPVFGARVEVAGGGLGVTGNGTYRLYGVVGDVELRASRDGYRDNTKRVRITGHQIVDFDLELSAPREELAGRYSLTIAAAEECRAALPEQARVRTYTAVLAQKGATLKGTLEGAEFYVESYGTLNRFTGTVQPDRVTFRMNPSFYYYYGYLPDIVERLATPTSTYLSIKGDVVTTESGGRHSGPLDGVIESMDASFRRLASCRSRNHQFVLSR